MWTIPLSARTLALVDFYDALTTERVYKPAFSREKAKDIIIAGHGSDFDPDIIEAFLIKDDEFHQIALAMADKV